MTDLNTLFPASCNLFAVMANKHYHATDLHTMQSVSKTITSVILGVAITRGDFKASLKTSTGFRARQASAPQS